MNIAIDHNHFGLGAYSLPEAARLLRLSRANVRRWLSGYQYSAKSDTTKKPIKSQPSLWKLQYPKIEDHYILGFKDLIELKIVAEFVKQGVSVQTVRKCLNEAKLIIDNSHPFTTRQFRSDGVTIFLQQTNDDGAERTLDLKKRQFVIRKVMEQSFKDLDIEDNIVSRWRPYLGKKSIVIDPKRSFGQPVASEFGVPTVTLAQAVHAEGSVRAVANLYEVPANIVRDAVAYEKSLAVA
jgi:uncharacterized protein (DUF433 family)/transposase